MNPWEETLVNSWKKITSGKRRFITVPLFLAAIFFPWLIGLINSSEELYERIQIIVTEKRSYPTKSELDVFDENVVLVQILNDEKTAKETFESFQKAYLKSGHEVWINDLHLVRNDNSDGEWLIVIDTYPGQSNKKDIQGAIENLWDFSRYNRDMENTFGRWLNGIRPIYYSKNNFESTYGLIAEKD